MSGHGDKLGRNGEQAHETEGAFRVGTHHDLVTALGLAVQLPSGSLAAVELVVCVKMARRLER